MFGYAFKKALLKLFQTKLWEFDRSNIRPDQSDSKCVFGNPFARVRIDFDQFSCYLVVYF